MSFQGRAACPAYAHPVQRRSELVEQPGLAEPGVTFYQADAEGALRCRSRHPLERRQLGPAAEKQEPRLAEGPELDLAYGSRQ